MDKLTPQNAEQQHMVQILLAKMQGFEVEHFACGDWHHSPSNYFDFKSTYRIKSHELPITREMWAMIDEKWKWAAEDGSGDVYFYTAKPLISKSAGIWLSGGDEQCRCALMINTNGIDWRKSLTRRPEGV